MTSILALDPAWWQQTFLIKVPIGLLAVLLVVLLVAAFLVLVVALLEIPIGVRFGASGWLLRNWRRR